MLCNEKGIRIKLRADQLLIVATVVMMAAIISYTPEPNLDTDVEAPPEQEDASVIYSEALDDSAMDLIELSNFTMIRRIQANSSINYEVYAKAQVSDLGAEAEDLCRELEGLWGATIPNVTIRVLVINNQDAELVDLIAENGKTIFHNESEERAK